MSELVTVNIRVPKKDYRKYKAISQKRGVSFAGMVREALMSYSVRGEGYDEDPKKKKHSIWDLGTKLVNKKKDKDGVTDVAARHDYYLGQIDPHGRDL
jgi:hypothetical protein